MSYAEGGFNPSKHGKKRPVITVSFDTWEAYIPALRDAKRNRSIMDEAKRSLEQDDTDG